MIQFRPTRFAPAGFDCNYGDTTHLGFIPSFLSEYDPRPAREQLDQNYAHGGGWSPMPGWQLQSDGESLRYPGDPVLHPLAEAKLRDETIRFYDCAFVAIFQPDGSFEVDRLD